MVTLEKIRELLKKKGLLHCRWCAQDFDVPAESYDHDGGVVVEGFKKKQWVFFICPRCQYAWSLHKLLKGLPLHA